MKFQTGYLASVDALFDAAVAELKSAGADITVIDALTDYPAIEERGSVFKIRSVASRPGF